MTWFTASIITTFKLKNRAQEVFTVHEDVIIIDAKDSNEAFVSANAIGKEMAIPDYNMEDGPAEVVFVGVRKIVEVTGTMDDPNPKPLKIETGAEVSYNVYRVSSWKDVEKLVEGEEVEVVYQD